MFIKRKLDKQTAIKELKKKKKNELFDMYNAMGISLKYAD